MESLLTAAANLFVRGHGVDWSPLLRGGRRVDLPTYAFQRRRFWLELPTATSEPTTSGSPIVSTDPITDEIQQPATFEDFEPGDGAELAGRLDGLGDQEKEEILLEVVRAEAAAVLGHDDSDAIEDEAGFFDVGFTSLTAVELRNKLSGVTGLRLPAMLLFDHPSPALLAEHLRNLLAKASV